jgi:general secretion pathway protein A
LQKWETAGHRVAYVNNPTLTRDEFVECLAQTYGLPVDARSSKTRMLTALTELVMRRHEQGLITGLLIDEAQSLPDALLEEIRLLANVETASEKLFPVVLAGQPELADRLNAPGQRQLKQRIGLRCVLSALDVRETGAYIAGRIRLAGGVGGQLFTREAVMAIHEYSGGIPRVINVICDNTLLSAFASNRRPATRDLVVEVVRDFDLAPIPAAPTTSMESLSSAPPEGVNAGMTSSSFESATPERSVEQAPGVEGEGSLFATYLPKRRFSFFG